MATFGFACTDFVVKAGDGSLVNGRSLEFAIDLQNSIEFFPKGENRTTYNPKKGKSFSWVSKYNYLAVTCFGADLVLDGMNEKGLTMGFLWLPGTDYPSVKADEMNKALDFVDFGAWVLGNFSSVAEAKEALKKTVVWGHPVPPLPGVPPVHIALHDATGAHLAVEFIKGEMKIYDNPNGVLTNAPPLDWHLINISNYLNLQALNANAIHFQNSVLTPPGQGSGLLGIPGDWTPPSRFIRASTFIHFAKQVSNGAQAVNLAEHILNTVDIPLGDVQADDKSEDYTQWVVIKNLTDKTFYFRTYNDLCLKKIDLTKITSKGSIPMNWTRGTMDVTSQFKTARGPVTLND